MTGLELIDGEEALLPEGMDAVKGEERRPEQCREDSASQHRIAARHDPVASSSSVVISASRMIWYANREGHKRASLW